jgi:hypothetical protein
MFRKNNRLIIGLMAIMLVLFIASEAMSFSDEPCAVVNWASCDSQTCPDCVAPPSTLPYIYVVPESGWVVTLHEIESLVDGLFAWKLSALRNGTISGLKKFDLAYPNCRCTTPQTYVSPGTNTQDGLSSPANLKVYEPFEGAPSGWGQSIDLWVVQAPPDNSGIYRLVTNTDKMTWGPVNLEVAGGDLAFNFPVPACATADPPPEVFVGDTTNWSTVCKTLIDDCLDLDNNPGTPCTPTKLSADIPSANGAINLYGITWYPYSTDCGETCPGQPSCPSVPTAPAATSSAQTQMINTNSYQATVEEAPYYCSGLGDEKQSECIQVVIGSLTGSVYSGGNVNTFDWCSYWPYPPYCYNN